MRELFSSLPGQNLDGLLTRVGNYRNQLDSDAMILGCDHEIKRTQRLQNSSICESDALTLASASALC